MKNGNIGTKRKTLKLHGNMHIVLCGKMEYAYYQLVRNFSNMLIVFTARYVYGDNIVETELKYSDSTTYSAY